LQVPGCCCSAPLMPAPPPLSPGAAVKFVGGTYKGKSGVVEKLTPQKAYVSSPDIVTSPVLVNRTSVEALSEDVAGLKLEEGPSGEADSPAPHTPQDRKGSDSRRNPRRAVRQSPLSLESPSPMQLASTSDAERLQLGGMPVSKLVVGDKQNETCLLTEWLGEERVLVVERPLPRGGGAELVLPDSRASFHGRDFEFVASKVHDDGIEPWGGKKKCLRMTYAATEGPGLMPVSLQAELYLL
jgi:hypothetical protein